VWLFIDFCFFVILHLCNGTLVAFSLLYYVRFGVSHLELVFKVNLLFVLGALTNSSIQSVNLGAFPYAIISRSEHILRLLNGFLPLDSCFGYNFIVFRIFGWLIMFPFLAGFIRLEVAFTGSVDWTPEANLLYFMPLNIPTYLLNEFL